MEHQTHVELVKRPEQKTDLLRDLIARLPFQGHLRVHTSYNLTVPPHWRIDSRCNLDYHIVLIKGGEGSYTTGDGSYEFVPGQIILVSRGLVHSAAQITENPPAIIPIRFGLYDNITREPLKLEHPPFSIACIPSDRQGYSQLFEQIHTYSQQGEIGYYDRLSGILLCELLMKLYIDCTQPQPANPLDTRLEKVKRFMDDNPQARYNPVQLAETAELSEKYLRSLFKVHYGVTPLDYHKQARMNYARFLLSECGHSIKHVALTLGYPDPYSFSKQFKQQMGYPPLQVKGKISRPSR